jgi:toxin secretion/phage lysis holin
MGGSEMKEHLSAAVGVAAGVLSWLARGFDTPILALVVCMGVDYVTGLIVAGVFHSSPKTPGGGLDSRVGWKGLARKFVTILIVMVAHLTDVIMGTGDTIRTAVCIGFFANECLSLVENAGHMGLRIPRKLADAVEELVGKGDEITDKVDEEE